MRTFALILCLFGSSVIAFPQGLSNATLSGRYYFRHLQFSTDPSNNVRDARSAVGAITFDGAGGYSVTSQQVVGAAAPIGLTITGAYTLNSAGVVTLANPQKPALSINARYATEAVIGSSTDSAENTFDLFVAIPASSDGVTAASLKGNYFATSFELTAGSTAQVRDASVSATFDGLGAITALSGRGHAANYNAGAIVSENLIGATYTLTPNGSGSVSFPAGSPTTLISSGKNIYLSRSGNLFIAANPAGHDLMIGVKAIAGSASNASLAGRYWQAGLRVDTVAANGSQAYSGSGVAIGSHAALNVSRRSRLLGSAVPVNYTGSLPFTIGADGSGSIGTTSIGLGSSGAMFTATTVSTLDPTAYEISLAIPIPALTGPGVFLNPQGVVNAASNAPGVDAISPGEFLALYGSGLAPTTKVSLPPYPPSLNGVSVAINGLPAPVYLVSSGQINCLVPYGVTGTSATLVVTNGGVFSNPVTVPLGKTSPGIFSADTSGAGDGIIVHLDGTLVNAGAPATKNEILVMYLTGLGALATPLADGTGSPGADSALAPVTVLVDGIPAPASNFYAGAGVQFPGLYQINFTVPANLVTTGAVPVAIQTPDAFHDQISLAIQ